MVVMVCRAARATGSDARTTGRAAEQDGAGAALAFAAAVFGAGEAEFIAEDREQRRVWRIKHGVALAVNGDFEGRRHTGTVAGGDQFTRPCEREPRRYAPSEIFGHKESILAYLICARRSVGGRVEASPPHMVEVSKSRSWRRRGVAVVGLQRLRRSCDRGRRRLRGR